MLDFAQEGQTLDRIQAHQVILMAVDHCPTLSSGVLGGLAAHLRAFGWIRRAWVASGVFDFSLGIMLCTWHPKQLAPRLRAFLRPTGGGLKSSSGSRSLGLHVFGSADAQFVSRGDLHAWQVLPNENSKELMLFTKFRIGRS